MADENLEPAASEANQHVFSAEERAAFMQACELLISAPGPYSREWIAQQLASGSLALPLATPTEVASDSAE